MDMPARVTKRADPPTAATCGFFEDEAALRQPSSSCDSRCAFVDDQVAFMPRGLASCYFRLTKHTAGLPPNVSASTGQPRVLLAGPSWGAAVPGSGCGQRCGFGVRRDSRSRCSMRSARSSSGRLERRYSDRVAPPSRTVVRRMPTPHATLTCSCCADLSSEWVGSDAERVANRCESAIVGPRGVLTARK